MKRKNTQLGTFGAIESAEGMPVLEVAKEISDRLRQRGVPHALVGGLAVAAHGYERHTKDVDMLVPSDRAYVLKSATRSAVYGLSLRDSSGLTGIAFYRRGVEVDLMCPVAGSLSEDVLDRLLAVPKAGVVPILPAPGLVYMKLVAGRAKDDADVVELLKTGLVSTTKVHVFLSKAAPKLVGRFEELAGRSDEESRLDLQPWKER